MSVTVNREQLGEMKALLDGLQLNGAKILSRSLNRTATRGRKRANEEIRKQVRLKSTYINEKLKIDPANWKKLRARITAAKRGVLLTRYPHTVLRRGGVTVGIKTGGARARLPSAFKTTVRAGGKTVEVIALPDTGRYSTGNRRMKVVYSPSVSQVFNKTRDIIDAELATYLERQVESQVESFLKGF